jgi:hypothetical protein
MSIRQRFNPTSSNPERALQAWQILIGAAMRRQTFTYLGLSRGMYRRDAAGVLAKILGHVAYFCRDHDLPALTAIVVGKRRGSPGSDIPGDPSKMDEIRESVFDFDWYDIVPPTLAELTASFERHHRSDGDDPDSLMDPVGRVE